MTISRITSEEQVTIALDIPIANLAGILHRPDQPTESIDEMNQSIQDDITAKFDQKQDSFSRDTTDRL